MIHMYEQLEGLATMCDELPDVELAAMVRELLDYIWFHRLTPADRDALDSCPDVPAAPEL